MFDGFRASLGAVICEISSPISDRPLSHSFPSPSFLARAPDGDASSSSRDMAESVSEIMDNSKSSLLFDIS